MAFLDNSGDIILDAVLTEAGRRRMANGTFRITKFALGDDEIDYSLYNKNHPSGSAYYDLEILQTPIFEAFTQLNAGINYGLLKNTATDLLYLPTMIVNELGFGVNNAIAKNNIFYVTDTGGDTGTTITDNIATALKTTLSFEGFMDGDMSPSSKFLLIETGLNTGYDSIPVGTEANRNSFLVANNLIDNTFYVYFDNRFFSSVMSIRPAPVSYFTNAASNNNFNGNLSLGQMGNQTNIDVGLDNYSSARVSTIDNQIYRYTSNNTEQLYSVIGGPRASVGGISMVINPNLDAEYSLYGTTNDTTLISGTTVKYIDTTVYIEGATTGAQTQIPVRIIRVA